MAWHSEHSRKTQIFIITREENFLLYYYHSNNTKYIKTFMIICSNCYQHQLYLLQICSIFRLKDNFLVCHSAMKEIGMTTSTGFVSRSNILKRTWLILTGSLKVCLETERRGYACIILYNMFIIKNTNHFIKLQTNEIRVASGYHSEFMQYTVSSNVPWTQTATGDLATFKLMSW